ncbi:hypothetical protein GmHk_12G034865 [Glycine max]|nr:hypothetical protein GmHk_12G034865 [Glycine max]
MCLKVAAPLMVGLRLVDSYVKPTMCFIYEEMENAKEKIKCNFNNIMKSYDLVWKIIDERWDHQLHRPLHVAAYYLNPHLHYEPTFRHDDPQLKVNKIEKSIALPFDEIESDDEWITEKGYNDEDEQPQAEGDGGNVELVGDVGGNLDDDGDGDESDDIHGDDPIRGLDMLL